MKKRITALALMVLCVIFSCGCEIVKSPDYYMLAGNDEVASFTKVVGSRKVNTTKRDLTNAIQSISYSYKEVEAPYEDAEKYLDYLTGEEGFSYSGMLDMDEKEDEIVLTKTSENDKQFEIRVKITYNTDTKIVKIVAERERMIE